MGVIALALFSNGSIDHFYIPDLGEDHRRSRDRRGHVRRGLADHAAQLGQRLYKIEPAAGFSAQVTAGAVIDVATRLGYPLSTTHVISGGVLGAGSTKSLSAVRWGIAGNIVTAWFVTIPAAALVAAAFDWPVEAIF